MPKRLQFEPQHTILRRHDYLGAYFLYTGHRLSSRIVICSLWFLGEREDVSRDTEEDIGVN